jgi:hypothetical protein
MGEYDHWQKRILIKRLEETAMQEILDHLPEGLPLEMIYEARRRGTQGGVGLKVQHRHEVASLLPLLFPAPLMKVSSPGYADIFAPGWYIPEGRETWEKMRPIYWQMDQGEWGRVACYRWYTFLGDHKIWVKVEVKQDPGKMVPTRISKGGGHTVYHGPWKNVAFPYGDIAWYHKSGNPPRNPYVYQLLEKDYGYDIFS